MYYIYRVDCENSIPWHIYAQNWDDAREIYYSFEDSLIDDCRDLIYDINYEEIAREIPCGYELSQSEIKSINEFFTRFDEPIIKQYETVGGYVFDFCLGRMNQRSSLVDVETKLYCLDSVQYGDGFFGKYELGQVELKGGKPVCIPDYNATIKAKLKISKRNDKEWFEKAQSRFGFQSKFEKTDELNRYEFYDCEIQNIQQFCQILNMVPHITIESIVCHK